MDIFGKNHGIYGAKSIVSFRGYIRKSYGIKWAKMMGYILGYIG